MNPKKALFVFLLMVVLLFALLTPNRYPKQAFGGGGGTTFSVSSRPVLNPFVDGLIAWGISYVLDRIANTPCSQVPHGGCDSNQPAKGPTGGGGGDAF